MLAERGEKLNESIDLVQRALKVEPDNGSYLDSLVGVHKANKLELARQPQTRADQLARTP
jgi:hypothetical protein